MGKATFWLNRASEEYLENLTVSVIYKNAKNVRFCSDYWVSDRNFKNGGDSHLILNIYCVYQLYSASQMEKTLGTFL